MMAVERADTNAEGAWKFTDGSCSPAPTCHCPNAIGTKRTAIPIASQQGSLTVVESGEPVRDKRCSGNGDHAALRGCEFNGNRMSSGLPTVLAAPDAPIRAQHRRNASSG
jgi:hypothetical protein